MFQSIRTAIGGGVPLLHIFMRSDNPLNNYFMFYKVTIRSINHQVYKQLEMGEVAELVRIPLTYHYLLSNSL